MGQKGLTHDACSRAHPQAHLAHDVGAEVDGGNLVDLFNCAGMDVGGLHVAAAQAALTQRALADGVEAAELNVALVGLPQLMQHLASAHKGQLVLPVHTMLTNCMQGEAGQESLHSCFGSFYSTGC